VLRNEIEKTDSLIHRAGQTREPYVRPPYGKRLLGLPLYLKREGRPVILWDLEPDTYFTRVEDVTSYVLDRAQPGSIILLHAEMPRRWQNRSALEGFVTELKGRGYRFVTLSALLAHADGTQ
jgi:chitin deacetylase